MSSLHRECKARESLNNNIYFAVFVLNFFFVKMSSFHRARKALSELHVRLALEGFTEVFVDQLTKDMVAVTRHCPVDRR